MWQQLKVRTSRVIAAAWTVARPWMRRALGVVAAFVRGPLLVVLHTVAALILLFAEWGWEPLVAALSRLSKYFVFARLEAWIARLPPYGALALFAAPAICLVPIKLLALYLFATGHPTLGIVLIIAAKVAGTAVVARIFMLVKPQLMDIAWFKSGYDRFLPWKAKMFAQIRASSAWRTGRIVRVEVKRGLNRTWIEFKPQRAWAKSQFSAIRAEVVSFIDDLRRGMH